MYKKMYRNILKESFIFKAIVRVLILGLIITLTVNGCTNLQPDEQTSETRLFLDTFCTITIYSSLSEQVLADILDRAFEMIREYEELFSITIEGSDIWRINHAGGEPVEVDPQTIEVIKAGIGFGELSGGMFDITIGRLSRLWDFSSNRTVPDMTEIDAAQLTVDYRQVNINGNLIQLTDSGAWIDLGAIAKGFIADRVAGFLVFSGINSAVIDLGGDVVTIGSRPDGNPWRIGVRDPTDHLIGIIEADAVSIISSGTYERMFEEDGALYHHVLNPYTGMPVNSDIVSATVVTDNAVTGEGLSTIALLLGSKEAPELIERIPGFIGAVLLLDNGDIQTFGDINFTDARSA